MYRLPMTAKLWKRNPRTWLTQYLQACADNGARAPLDLEPFLPWSMTPARLKALRAHANVRRVPSEAFDTS